MPRSRAAGLVLGILVVAYFPVVTVWASLQTRVQRAPVSSCASSGVGRKGGQSAVGSAVPRAHGTRQVLHVAVPGTATTREVVVYRPPVPDSANLPVLYFL